MKVELVSIGNSRGIRIPKPVLEQCGFDKMVELSIEKGRLVITAGRRPREGWRDAFRAAGKSAADELLLEPLKPNTFDREEWKW